MMDSFDSFWLTIKVRQIILLTELGCTLIAVFGVPITHTDDPIRAVAAALSIKNQLKTMGLKTYIGVTCDFQVGSDLLEPVQRFVVPLAPKIVKNMLSLVT